MVHDAFGTTLPEKRKYMNVVFVVSTFHEYPAVTYTLLHRGDDTYVEDTEWFGVIFELPDILVVEYPVISSSLLKGLWQGSADGLDVCEKYLVV